VTCNNGPNGDMFMNYMDYVDDAAMFMFTAGQIVRMQACLDGDRSSIGTTVATLPAVDQPTLKFGDDNAPTLKFRDDQPPPTLKFRDDNAPTLKFRDDQPTIKFRDDVPPPTIKFRDDAPPTQPQLDQQPKSPISDGPGFPPGGGGDPGFRGRRAVPFILSTPHHSMAWTRTFPQSAAAAAASYEQQILEYEQLLSDYVEADAAGQLLPEERQQAEAIHEEYLALYDEYWQQFGA